MATPEHVDVLIVGAGISGIGAACHLTRECPGKTFAILERRAAMGGTWDLFRYPGVRSDSDMYTFGFAFRPWRDTRTLADGASIRRYVRDTAAEYGVDRAHPLRRPGRHAPPGRAPTAAGASRPSTRPPASPAPTPRTSSSAPPATTTTTPATAPSSPARTASAAGSCTRSTGRKTSTTPARTSSSSAAAPPPSRSCPRWPTRPRTSRCCSAPPPTSCRCPRSTGSPPRCGRLLPDSAAYKLARAKQHRGAARRPTPWRVRSRTLMRGFVQKNAARQLAGASDIANFTPVVRPVGPAAVRGPRRRPVPHDPRRPGRRRHRPHQDLRRDRHRAGRPAQHLDADIVVTATGLEVQMLGGAQLRRRRRAGAAEQPRHVQGRAARGRAQRGHDLRLHQRVVDAQGRPRRRATSAGCSTTWTRTATHRWSCTPRDADRGDGSVLGTLNSGYVRRGNDRMPRQGTHGPWKVRNDYLRDIPMLRRAPIDDGVLRVQQGRAGARPCARRRARREPAADGRAAQRLTARPIRSNDGRADADHRAGRHAGLRDRRGRPGPRGHELDGRRARTCSPTGIVHGGVYCSVVETSASIGAALWFGERGRRRRRREPHELPARGARGPDDRHRDPHPPRPQPAAVAGRGRRRRRRAPSPAARYGCRTCLPDRPRCGPAAACVASTTPEHAGCRRGAHDRHRRARRIHHARQRAAGPADARAPARARPAPTSPSCSPRPAWPPTTRASRTPPRARRPSPTSTATPASCATAVTRSTSWPSTRPSSRSATC